MNQISLLLCLLSLGLLMIKGLSRKVIPPIDDRLYFVDDRGRWYSFLSIRAYSNRGSRICVVTGTGVARLTGARREAFLAKSGEIAWA